MGHIHFLAGDLFDGVGNRCRLDVTKAIEEFGRAVRGGFLLSRPGGRIEHTASQTSRQEYGDELSSAERIASAVECTTFHRPNPFQAWWTLPLSSEWKKLE